MASSCVPRKKYAKRLLNLFTVFFLRFGENVRIEQFLCLLDRLNSGFRKEYGAIIKIFGSTSCHFEGKNIFSWRDIDIEWSKPFPQRAVRDVDILHQDHLGEEVEPVGRQHMLSRDIEHTGTYNLAHAFKRVFFEPKNVNIFCGTG